MFSVAFHFIFCLIGDVHFGLFSVKYALFLHLVTNQAVVIHATLVALK